MLESKSKCPLKDRLKLLQNLNRTRSIKSAQQRHKERTRTLTDAHRLGYVDKLVSVDTLGSVDKLGSAVRIEELRPDIRGIEKLEQDKVAECECDPQRCMRRSSDGEGGVGVGG